MNLLFGWSTVWHSSLPLLTNVSVKCELDQSEGYSSYVGEFSRIEMRLYLLDSLIYLAGSQAPYIHVILFYVHSVHYMIY